MYQHVSLKSGKVFVQISDRLKSVLLLLKQPIRILESSIMASFTTNFLN